MPIVVRGAERAKVREAPSVKEKEPADDIVEFAKEANANMIVMGVRKRCLKESCFSVALPGLL